MKLTISKSKNSASFYVTKSLYINGKHTSKIVEKLGTEIELREKLGNPLLILFLPFIRADHAHKFFAVRMRRS